MAHVLAKDLREAVLQAAMSGNLTSRSIEDTKVSDTITKIRQDRDKRILNKEIKTDKRLNDKLIEEPRFDIPNSWKWVRLGAVLYKLTDGTHKTPKYTENGVKFVSVKDMSSGFLNLSNTKYISDTEHSELFSRCNPEKGDILLSKVGTTGVPAIVNTDESFSLFVSVALLKFNDLLINRNYLYRVLQSPDVQQQAAENTKGIGNKNWVLDKIANTKIPLPPIEEQARIVAKVDEIMAKIDEYEKLENQLVKLKEQFPQDMKKSLLQAGMMGKLTEQLRDDTPVNLNLIKQAKNKQLEESDIELPKNWSKSSIEGICESISSKKYQIKDSQVLKDGKYKVVSQSQQGVIGYSNSADKLFSHELPVITFGDHTTIVKLIDFDFVVGADGLKIFKPNDIVVPKYFYYSLEQLCNGLENVGGYTRHYKYIKNKPLPIPPIEEQQRIVDKLDELLPLVDRLAELN